MATLQETEANIALRREQIAQSQEQVSQFQPKVSIAQKILRGIKTIAGSSSRSSPMLQQVRIQELFRQREEAKAAAEQEVMAAQLQQADLERSFEDYKYSDPGKLQYVEEQNLTSAQGKPIYQRISAALTKGAVNGRIPMAEEMMLVGYEFDTPYGKVVKPIEEEKMNRQFEDFSTKFATKQQEILSKMEAEPVSQDVRTGVVELPSYEDINMSLEKKVPAPITGMATKELLAPVSAVEFTPAYPPAPAVINRVLSQTGEGSTKRELERKFGIEFTNLPSANQLKFNTDFLNLPSTNQLKEIVPYQNRAGNLVSGAIQAMPVSTRYLAGVGIKPKTNVLELPFQIASQSGDILGRTAEKTARKAQIYKYPVSYFIGPPNPIALVSPEWGYKSVGIITSTIPFIAAGATAAISPLFGSALGTAISVGGLSIGTKMAREGVRSFKEYQNMSLIPQNETNSYLPGEAEKFNAGIYKARQSSIINIAGGVALMGASIAGLSSVSKGISKYATELVTVKNPKPPVKESNFGLVFPQKEESKAIIAVNRDIPEWTGFKTTRAEKYLAETFGWEPKNRGNVVIQKATNQNFLIQAKIKDDKALGFAIGKQKTTYETMLTPQEIRASSINIEPTDLSKISKVDRYVMANLRNELSLPDTKISLYKGVSEPGIPIGYRDIRHMGISKEGVKKINLLIGRPPTISEVSPYEGASVIRPVKKLALTSKKGSSIIINLPEESANLFQYKTSTKFSGSAFPRASGKLQKAEGLVYVFPPKEVSEGGLVNFEPIENFNLKATQPKLVKPLLTQEQKLKLVESVSKLTAKVKLPKPNYVIPKIPMTTNVPSGSFLPLASAVSPALLNREVSKTAETSKAFSSQIDKSLFKTGNVISSPQFVNPTPTRGREISIGSTTFVKPAESSLSMTPALRTDMGLRSSFGFRNLQIGRLQNKLIVPGEVKIEGVKSLSRLQTRSIERVRQAESLRSAQTLKSSQMLRNITSLRTPISMKYKSPIRPTPPKLKIPPLDEDVNKKKQLRSELLSELVVPFIKRQGKYKPVSKPTTLGLAIGKGISLLRGTLAASLQIRKAKTGEKIRFAKETNQFRLGKKEGAATLVQRAPKRLSSFGEVGEIIRSRRNKWI